MTTTQIPPQADPHRAARYLLGWLAAGVPLLCAWRVFDLLFHLFGERATAAEETEAAAWLMLAVVVSLAAPAAALRRGGGRQWCVALWIGAAFSTFAVLMVVALVR